MQPEGFFQTYNAKRGFLSNANASQASQSLPRSASETKPLLKRNSSNFALKPLPTLTDKASHGGGNEKLLRSWSNFGTPIVRSGTNLFRSEVYDDDSTEGGFSGTVPGMPVHVDGLRRREPKAGSLLGMRTDAIDTKPCIWVESAAFQGISALVIFGNAIVIGLETDIETPLWFWVEQALLIFFVFELTSRLCRHGFGFFTHEEDWVWNLLDFAIVLSGVVDQWGMPLIKMMKKHKQHRKNHHVGVVFMLMRMLRLLRIARLFRLVRVVRPLYQLAQGVLEALQGMLWVLVFMIMTLYATAILCTRFIGHGAALPDEMLHDEEVQKIRAMFGNVQESMFTLFGTMTSWSLLKFVPLFNAMPVLRPMFVIFYIYSAWALLAVMTGVVSENLIAIRDEMVHQEEEKEEKRKRNITKVLFDLFNEADADRSGSIERAEFHGMLKDPAFMKMLLKNSRLRIADLHDLFDWLDQDEGGTITIDEFMDGFKWVNDPLSAKSIMKLQGWLVGDLQQLSEETMGTTQWRFQQVMEVVTHPIQKVHAISEQIDHLDDMCSDLKIGLKQDIDNLPTLRELSSIELGLHVKLDNAFDQINHVFEAVR